MPMIRMPNPEDLPKPDWKKAEKEARKRAIELIKITEKAHKMASKSKLRFGGNK